MPEPTITNKPVPVLHYAPGIQPIEAGGESVIREILAACEIPSATITSTGRTVEAQARIMRENLEAHGIAAQLGLYAAAGDQVIRVYEKFHATLSRSAVEALMAEEIRKVGPGRVSHHICDANHIVFDVAPSSIPPEKMEEFIRVAASHPRVTKFLKPPADPALHLEVVINPTVGVKW